jgi:hypothetical protein
MSRARYLPLTLLLVAILIVPSGCAWLPGAPNANGPSAISPVGVKVSPLNGNRVHVTLEPGTASSNLGTVHIRAERGGTVVVRHAVPWNYRQGVALDVGNDEQPLKPGDTIAVGTSEVNTHVSVTISP